jgi:hypothetical protein
VVFSPLLPTQPYRRMVLSSLLLISLKVKNEESGLVQFCELPFRQKYCGALSICSRHTLFFLSLSVQYGFSVSIV